VADGQFGLEKPRNGIVHCFVMHGQWPFNS